MQVNKRRLIAAAAATLLAATGLEPLAAIGGNGLQAPQPPLGITHGHQQQAIVLAQPMAAHGLGQQVGVAWVSLPGLLPARPGHLPGSRLPAGTLLGTDE